MKIRVFFRTRFIIGFVLIIALSGCTGQVTVPENTTKPIPPVNPPTDTTSSNLTLTNADIMYDSSYTKAADQGIGYGRGSVFLTNTETDKDEVTSIEIFYANTFTGSWIPITNAISLQSISTGNSYEIRPLAIDEELTIRFPIPSDNIDNSVAYRMTITTKNGYIFDTSISDFIDEDNMLLTKDRPNLTPPSQLGTIRRTNTISPVSVSDNSEIKNVIYDVSTAYDFSSIDKSVTITSPLWRWQWNTYNDPDVSNGSYFLRMTVTDYAGLSTTTNALPFTIDNDYTPPTINFVVGETPFAEVGETYEITANIVDTGSNASDVQEVFLHYRLLNATSNTSLAMVEGLGNDWSASIPIDARSMEVNMTYYIEARDLDGNKAYDQTPILEAADTKKPDITHTLVTSADEQEEVLFSALVDDPGLVDTSDVFLFIRKSNDLGANTTVSGESLPSSWVQLSPSTAEKVGGITWMFSWIMPEPYYNVTIHALDYYISASDLYTSNTATHGTVSVPHHIQVLDLNPPDFVGISEENFPSTWTENTTYPITVMVNDNDPTFGRIVNGDPTTFTTGEVIIHYKDGLAPTFNPADINTTIHLSGNSSDGEITEWYGTIPKEVFVEDLAHRVDFYITVSDQSELDQNQHSVIPSRWPDFGYYSIDVIEAGQPNVIYSPGSCTLKNNDTTISLMLNNTAIGKDESADATLTDMYIEIYSKYWDFSNGLPNLTTVYFTRFNGINFSYSDTIGSPHPWGGNGTWISFGAGYEGLVIDDNGYNYIELTFSNTSGGSIDMHNMILNISFHADVGGTGVNDLWLGLVATPGVEPQSTIYASHLYSGRYYIGNWLVTPGYSYASTGLGWDSELEEPWTLPSEYSRNDISNGEVFPYHGFGITSGYGTFTTNFWKAAANNEGTNNYRMNIDTLMGSVSDTYVWFYAVVQFSGSIPSPAYMYLGSDDESVCYINGQVAGQYGSPRGYSETQFQVDALLIGNNEYNYVLFGVHDVGATYRCGLAFSTDFQVRIFTGPPSAPLGSSIMSIISPNISDFDFTTKMISKNTSPKKERSLIDIYRKIVLT